MNIFGGTMKLICKTFAELSIIELYDLMKLRTDIFVVEQDCAYPELDGFDNVALHIMGSVENELVAYSRIMPAYTVYEQISIGRVAVREDQRKNKLGKKLFDYTLKKTQEKYPDQIIKIQAQTYLEKFYASFGFKTISEPYPDVGVWHVDMIL